MSNKASLLFDGSTLKWEEDGEVVKEWPAMSGNKKYQSRKYTSEKDVGPIPEGKWYVRKGRRESADLLDDAMGVFGRGRWPGGRSSWGSDRIWLEPDSETDTKGRTDLSIHGGSSFGSKGCIDLSDGMSSFVNYFDAYDDDMDLMVEYPDWF